MPLIENLLDIRPVSADTSNMRKARWLAEWRNSEKKPVFYHCISRVVDRRFAFGAVEKEKFRALMRMQENFTGCCVVSYCLMDNHFHILLEVPPFAVDGLTDALLLERLAALYSEVFVAGVAAELAEARQQVKDGLGEEAVLVGRIHERFTYRMHDLGEFMKGLLQRYTQWHNRLHSRTGRLWENRFKSVIVEDGLAAKTMAAYIDLNPVRAGIVKDPAEYRWSSYGEAIGGGAKGNGKKARAGLVRIFEIPETRFKNPDGEWSDVARRYRRLMGMALERKAMRAKVDLKAVRLKTMNSAEALEAGQNETVLSELGMAKMLRCRVRYFTDGAVIGSKAFVNEAFAASRERFGAKRKDGARKMRGAGSAAAGSLWSFRDLRAGV